MRKIQLLLLATLLDLVKNHIPCGKRCPCR